MTDEEAEKLLPAVEEFVQVVRERNRDGLEACLAFTPARTLAVMLADLLWQERARAEANDVGRLRRALKEAVEANRFLSKKLFQEQSRVEELRGIIARRSA